jgi:archaellum component FlaG (FlaF/FlaG flagellin family)
VGSFSTFAQVEDGASRSLSEKSFDFGVIKNLTEHKILIKNDGKYDLIVGEIFVPKGVQITVLKHRIKPGETGVIIVSINPKYMNKGDFRKQVVVTTYTRNENGTRISFTKAYRLKGQML